VVGRCARSLRTAGVSAVTARCYTQHVSDTSPIWPAGLGGPVGAVSGYLVAQHVASRDAYRRGQQYGLNRLAARHARKTR